MNVTDIMTKDVISISQTKLVQDAADLMTEKDISALPIVDDNSNLVGIITESDFVGKAVEIPHALANIKQLFGQNFSGGNVEEICAKAKHKPLSEVMSTGIRTVTSDQTVTDVVNLMIEKDLKRIPVVEGKKLVGIVTRKDLMRAFSSK